MTDKDGHEQVLLPTNPGRAVGDAILPVLLDGGNILLDVAVNGAASAPFIVDTGAAISVLDADFAASIGAISTGLQVEAGPKGGRRGAGLARGLRFSVGPSGAVVIPAHDAVILDLPNQIVDRGKRPRVAGILGCNAFAERALRLDMRARTLAWLPQGADAAPGGTEIALTLGYGASNGSTGFAINRGMTMPVTLDGVTEQFLFDTGSNAEILLGYGYATEIGFRAHAGRCVSFAAPGGIDGSIRVVAAMGRSLEIGGQPIGTPVVVAKDEAVALPQRTNFRGLYPAPVQHIGFHEFKGIVGLPAFTGGVLFLDIQNFRLVLEPANPVPRRRVWRTTGISADKPIREKFTVLSAIAGTPAAAAGIEAGDAIVAVDGMDARDLGLADFGRLNAKPVGTVALSFADGRRISLPSVQVLP